MHILQYLLSIFKINIHLLFKVVLLLRLNTKIIICFPFNEIMHFTHSYKSAFVVTKQNMRGVAGCRLSVDFSTQRKTRSSKVIAVPLASRGIKQRLLTTQCRRDAMQRPSAAAAHKASFSALRIERMASRLGTL